MATNFNKYWSTMVCEKLVTLHPHLKTQLGKKEEERIINVKVKGNKTSGLCRNWKFQIHWNKLEWEVAKKHN